MKAETERSALDVKLKHARNQVDVEIKRRQRAEADCEKLVCIVLYARTMAVGGGGSIIWSCFHLPVILSFLFHIKELKAIYPLTTWP